MDGRGISTLLLVACIVLVSSQNDREKGRGKISIQIIGGEPASVADFPYMVSLQVKRWSRYKTRYDHYCGGSIINKSFIMTAAHCMEDICTSGNRVVAGITSQSEDPTTKSRFSHIYIHPSYNPETQDHDIALIRLRTPFVYRAGVQPVTLPSAGDFLIDGASVIAAGWGKTDTEDAPDHLSQVEMQTTDLEDCQRQHENDVSDDAMCATAVGKDACQGDSGGPLVLASRRIQFGITSWGEGCANEYPGVYTNVTAHLTWINSIIYPSSSSSSTE